jgi:Kef-type K+ transport system membrane component KefB
MSWDLLYYKGRCMHHEALVYSIFVIFTGTAIFSTLVLFTRQSLLVAYLLLGMLLGPWGFQLVTDTSLITQIGEVGIIFLLFVLGLHLHPQDLWHMLRKVTLIAVLSSLVFAAMGFGVALLFGFTLTEAIIVGAAMMFSSTIIGLKLLPTSILHRQHMGEIMISILLMQDMIAIMVLLFIHSAGIRGGLGWIDALGLVSFPGLLGFAFLMQRYVLSKLLIRFERVKEYIFLLAIGWCLGMAELGMLVGLSDGVGAFIGGVALAASPVAVYIAESLRAVRDFFLVLFFFSIGATFNLYYLPSIMIPSLVLAALVLTVKPWLFRVLLKRAGEKPKVAQEIGLRLGQGSEFSILLTYLAASSAPALIGARANYFIQAVTIITFIASCYFVVLRYPTPIALSDRLQRD